MGLGLRWDWVRAVGGLRLGFGRGSPISCSSSSYYYYYYYYSTLYYYYVLSYLLAVDEDPAVEGARLVRLRGRVRIRVRVRVRLRVRVRVRG